MTQNDKIIKWFYIVSAIATFIGYVFLIGDGDFDFDIYVVWDILEMAAGLYLINKLK